MKRSLHGLPNGRREAFRRVYRGYTVGLVRLLRKRESIRYMKKYIGNFLLLLAMLVAPAAVRAQQVAFEVDAPRVVGVGEIFRIEYVLDTKPQNFAGPQFEGVDVLAGPTLSTSRSVSVRNGNMSQEVRYTYTYVLQCNAEGEFKVSEAVATVKGKSWTVAPFVIRALREQDSGREAEGGQASGHPTLAPDDILLRAVVDRTEVYKGEPVRVTYKLYRRVPLNLESARFPTYNGFWAQQLNVDGQSPQREAFGGKIYDTHVIREDLLFPQQAGSLTVDPLELSVVAQIMMEPRRQSVIDDFFGGPNVQEVRRNLSTKAVPITVRELPAGAPADFSGAVGDFQMELVAPPAEVVANSAFTVGIKISGSGNLPQVQAPKLSLPSSFEQYNVKTTESFNHTAGGIYGYRQFEYPVIARAAGDYDLAPIEFTYFNPRLGTYETLSARQPAMTVLPDEAGTGATSGGTVLSGLSKEDIRILGKDIRFIKLDAPHLHRKGRLFFGSLWYFLALGVICGVFVGLWAWLRRVVEERRNSVLLKGKRANKVALLRFRAAEGHMKADNPRGFYEEMLKALWGYIRDKLNIPSSNLTKENVREELVKRGVSAEVAQRYIDIIVECEYAQYAPAATGRMPEVYGAGVEIVSRLEGIIGK